MITSEQLYDRKKGTGGSDIHNLTNEKPYGCERKLHYDKTDEKPDFPFIITPPIKRGNDLEGLVCEKYTEATSRKLKKLNLTLYNRNHKYAIGHIDRVILNDSRGVGVFEAKTSGLWMDKKIEEEGLPVSYIYQLQWYMQDGWYYVNKSGKEINVNFKWGAFGVFSIEKWELTSFDVEKDDDMIRALRDLNSNFWQNVKDGVFPDRLLAKDRRCRNCSYRTKCQGDYLIKNVDGESHNDESLNHLFNRYDDIKDVSDSAKIMLKDIKDEISEKIGNRGEIKNKKYKATHKPMVSRRLNTRLLKQELPDIYSKYVSKSVSRPLKIKKIEEE